MRRFAVVNPSKLLTAAILIHFENHQITNLSKMIAGKTYNLENRNLLNILSRRLAMPVIPEIYYKYGSYKDKLRNINKHSYTYYSQWSTLPYLIALHKVY